MPNPSLSDQMADHVEGKERLEFARQVDREAIEAERKDVIAFIEKRTLFLNARGEVGDTFRVDELLRLLRQVRSGEHSGCAT